MLKVPVAFCLDQNVWHAMSQQQFSHINLYSTGHIFLRITGTKTCTTISWTYLYKSYQFLVFSSKEQVLMLCFVFLSRWFTTSRVPIVRMFDLGNGFSFVVCIHIEKIILMLQLLVHRCPYERPIRLNDGEFTYCWKLEVQYCSRYSESQLIWLSWFSYIWIWMYQLVFMSCVSQQLLMWGCSSDTPLELTLFQELRSTLMHLSKAKKSQV